MHVCTSGPRQFVSDLEHLHDPCVSDLEQVCFAFGVQDLQHKPPLLLACTICSTNRLCLLAVYPSPSILHTLPSALAHLPPSCPTILVSFTSSRFPRLSPPLLGCNMLENPSLTHKHACMCVCAHTHLHKNRFYLHALRRLYRGDHQEP